MRLEVEQLKKRYGRNKVLDGLSFEVKEGEVFGIMGPSGVGKSTLLGVLTGFLDFDSGSIRYIADGRRIHGSDVKMRIGVAPQTPSFYPRLTVEENVKYFSSLYGIDKKIFEKRLDSLLNFFWLSENKKDIAKNLSGGMQRRLSVCCALVHDPDLVIMDEPVSDLDPILRDEMWELIRKMNKEGRTIIIASHFLDELEGVCNRVGLMEDGIFVKEGKLDEIRKGMFDYFEVNISADEESCGTLLRDIRIPILDKSFNNGKLTLITRSPEMLLKDVLNAATMDKIDFNKISYQKPSLKEIFRVLSKR